MANYETSYEQFRWLLPDAIDEYIWYTLSEEQLELIYLCAGSISRQEFISKYVERGKKEQEEYETELAMQQLCKEESEQWSVFI